MRNTFLALASASVVLILPGCRWSVSVNTAPSATQQGLVAIFATDAPLCDILSFQAAITDAALTSSDGGAPVSVVSAASPVRVDFARLVDFATILQLSRVPPGTYSNLTLTLANPQLIVLDATQAPPAALGAEYSVYTADCDDRTESTIDGW
jgi:hypothetical protein